MGLERARGRCPLRRNASATSQRGVQVYVGAQEAGTGWYDAAGTLTLGRRDECARGGRRGSSGGRPGREQPGRRRRERRGFNSESCLTTSSACEAAS